MYRGSLIALAVANAIAGTALAQEAPEESGLDTVVVTGSRATGRTVRNSAAPIDVVSSDALQATGKGNLLAETAPKRLTVIRGSGIL